MARRSVPMLASTAAAVGVVLAAGVASGQQSSTSAVASTYAASAGGELSRAVVRFVPPILQEDLVDPGALSANAAITSFGESSAYASNPYPGSLPVSLPGLVDGVLGGAVDLPDYPLIAQSTHPSAPSSTVSAGSMTLRAESRQRESRGSVHDGGNRTEAEVRADEVTGEVVARAVAEVGSVDSGPSLRIAGVRSAATVTQAPDGELVRETEFAVATMSVLGNQLRLTPQGLELADVKLPADQAAEAVHELLAALAEQGTTVRFTDAVETPEGVISPGLEIERSLDTGVNGVVATVVTSYGRTFASVSNQARPSADDVEIVSAPVDGGGTPVDLSGALPPAPSAPAGAPSAATSPAAPAPAGATGPEVAARPVSALRPEEIGDNVFYPAMVGAGVVLAAASGLFRKLGRELAWTS